MSAEVRQAVELLRGALAEVEPECLEGRDARAALEDLAEVQRLAGAGVTLLARRVAVTGCFDRARFRTAAHYLAKTCGITVFAAEQLLRTAEQVEALPATEHAMREGRLSPVQAQEVAAGAAADPAAEPLLLQRAETDGVRGLRATSTRVQAAAADDTDARYERVHRERSFRHWAESDVAGRIDIRGPLDLTTRITRALVPYEEELFDQARQRPIEEWERPDALPFDALVALAAAATGPLPKATANRATVVVRIDHRALLTGATEPGEVCELAGVGPIPVSVAQRYLDDAFVKAILTDGVDVLAVAHLGRRISAPLRTAVLEQFPECVIAGCNTSYALEIDHNQPIEAGGITELANLNPLCPYHHQYKHRHDLRLAGDGTTKHFVPAHEWQPPERRRTPTPLAAA